MNAQTDTGQLQEASDPSSGLISRIRRLPVISWIWPERRSAEAGAGCGAVGGACCAGGAVVKGLGLASAASVSGFVADATPYFVGISIALMLAWVVWLARQVNFKPKALGQTLVRQAVVMGSIYAVVLGATMGIAYAAGV